jgi:hypothetical protein
MPLQTYLGCPGFNDLDRPRGEIATPTVNDRWRQDFLGGIGGRWPGAQPSAVQVFIPQTECVTRLAALQPLGRGATPSAGPPANARRLGPWGAPTADEGACGRAVPKGLLGTCAASGAVPPRQGGGTGTLAVGSRP